MTDRNHHFFLLGLRLRLLRWSLPLHGCWGGLLHVLLRFQKRRNELWAIQVLLGLPGVVGTRREEQRVCVCVGSTSVNGAQHSFPWITLKNKQNTFWNVLLCVELQLLHATTISKNNSTARPHTREALPAQWGGGQRSQPTHSVKPFHFKKNSTFPFTRRWSMTFSTTNSSGSSCVSFRFLGFCFLPMLHCKKVNKQKFEQHRWKPNVSYHTSSCIKLLLLLWINECSLQAQRDHNVTESRVKPGHGAAFSRPFTAHRLASVLTLAYQVRAA